MILAICYTLLYVFGRTGLSKQSRPMMRRSKCGVSSGSTQFTFSQLFKTQQWVVNSSCSKYGKELWCLNTEGNKYGKVTYTEIK